MSPASAVLSSFAFTDFTLKVRLKTILQLPLYTAYGDFSAIKILPEYDGPAPSDDAFIPFDNDYHKLDRKFEPRLSHAFRCALLLGGVDWMGWAGSTSAAHTSDDVDRTVKAFSDALELLRADGLVD